jgi:hypothetical protein
MEHAPPFDFCVFSLLFFRFDVLVELSIVSCNILAVTVTLHQISPFFIQRERKEWDDYSVVR